MKHSPTGENSPDGHPPLRRHGPLRVVGRHLVNAAGSPVRLRGLSTHGLHWFGPDTFLSTQRLTELRTFWRADLLRLAVYPDEGGYLAQPSRLDDAIHALVAHTRRLGLYCIIDWHLLHPGDPLARLDAAAAFFARLARRYRREPHLLFELCNEPNGPGVDWPRVRRYAQRLIPVIRRFDPDRVLLLGTPGWSSFGAADGTGPESLLRNPLTGTLARNLLYTFHFYAASHGAAHRRAFAQVAARLPVFVSEWGMNRASGHGPPNLPRTRRWLALLDRHRTSWVYWNYSNERSACAVFRRNATLRGTIEPAHLKPAGRLLLGLLRSPTSPACTPRPARRSPQSPS